MSEKKGSLEVSANVLEPHRLPASKAYRKMAEIDDTAYIRAKVKEVANLLWHSRDSSQEENDRRIARALELYESLKPQDGAEGMLAMQMVGTHDAALECLRRVALPGQSFEGRDMNLKHAHKLMSLYTQQRAALNKHRGKGQQKVTVEHVNVAPGGQAFVGTVEQGKNELPKGTEPRVLDHEDPLDVEDALNPASKEAPKIKARKQ